MHVLPMKHPSAVVPVVMSLAALALVLGHVAIYGIVHEADEGTPAHLFQLLMAGQVPIILYFVATWLPREPRQALQMLGVQFAAAVAAFASVYFLT